jgi:hypothetical protein
LKEKEKKGGNNKWLQAESGEERYGVAAERPAIFGYMKGQIYGV